ncbi:hypothetical protein LWI29_011557 [Acer saccharum]|uniref:Apple domain-containing protein n=1 Tax=Acer saccharum TaxID=4024 RepID=A0AA39SVW7_ACESA|nr:hypothetical protein LWI29_011557 [Acer saccharum]
MRIDPHGSPQLVLKKGPELVLRAGSWNGLHWTGAPTLKANSVYSYDFVSNEKEVSYVYYIHDSSVLSRTVMNQSGLAQRFTWINQTRTWAEFYAKMRDECDNYAQCGAYAICNINNFPVCTCFETFKPKSEQQWNVLNWTAGCVRKALLDCQRGDDGFLKIEALKLPDTSHSRAEKNISLVECEKSCLKNCSCTAYATLDIISGSGCLLLFTDLMDIKEILGGQDLYVRIAASELGKIESRRQHSWKKNVIIIVVSIVSVMGVLVLVWIMYARKIKRRNEGNTYDNRKMDENGEGSGKDDSGLTMRMTWSIGSTVGGGTIDPSSADSPNGGTGTRLIRAIQAFQTKLGAKIKELRKDLLMKVFFLVGFYCATAFATVIGQTGDWDSLFAALALVLVEGIGALMYKGSFPLLNKIRSLITVFNYWKAGLSLGLFLDSFKYEMDNITGSSNPFNLEIDVFSIFL